MKAYNQPWKPYIFTFLKIQAKDYKVWLQPMTSYYVILQHPTPFLHLGVVIHLKKRK